MELESSQERATFPYPEPDQSSPRPPSLFLKLLNIILPFTSGSSKLSPNERLFHLLIS
jgi:hypothetical protein